MARRHWITNMRRALAGLVFVVLGGCAAESPDFDIADYDYRARYPLYVKSDTMIMEIAGRGGTALGYGELEQIDAFVDNYRAVGAAPLVIAMPGDGTRHLELAGTVAERARERGLSNKEVVVARAPELPSDGPLTVKFRVYQAMLPECGWWGEAQLPKFDNANHENYACATQRNIGLMVANPRDLVEPQEMTPKGVARTVDVIDAHEQGESTVSDTAVGQSTLTDF